MSDHTPDREARARLQNQVRELQDRLTGLLAQLDQERAQHKECHMVMQGEIDALSDGLSGAYESLGRGAPYVVISAQGIVDTPDGELVSFEINARPDLSRDQVNAFLAAGVRLAEQDNLTRSLEDTL